MPDDLTQKDRRAQVPSAIQKAAESQQHLWQISPGYARPWQKWTAHQMFTVLSCKGLEEQWHWLVSSATKGDAGQSRAPNLSHLDFCRNGQIPAWQVRIAVLLKQGRCVEVCSHSRCMPPAQRKPLCRLAPVLAVQLRGPHGRLPPAIPMHSNIL